MINQHFHHDLQETSYILPRVRRSFKGTLNPVSKPVIFNRTLCSVKCIPENECLCTSEHLRSSSLCSDFSGSGLSTMLGADSIDLHDAPIGTRRNGASPVNLPDAQAELSQPSPLPKPTTTSTATNNNKASSPTTGTTGHKSANKENSERAANLFLSMRLSGGSDRSAAVPEKPSNWYSKTGAFSSVYLRQFTVHTRNLYAELTPELMQLKPQYCMSLEGSEELKRQSVFDPTVLLGYQVFFSFNLVSIQYRQCLVVSRHGLIRFSTVSHFRQFNPLLCSDNMPLFTTSEPIDCGRPIFGLRNHRPAPKLTFSYRVQTISVCTH